MKKFFIVSFLLLSLNNAWSIEENYKNLLKSLVNKNSATNNPEGLRNVRAKLAQELTNRGLELQDLDNNGRHVLVAKRTGQNPKILFMGHMDTVFNVDDPFNSFVEERDVFRGPGVIDMKGGLVLMLNLWDQLPESAQNQILFIINDDEEIGSASSKSLYLPLVSGIKYALIFEPGLDDAAYVSSQSGVKWINLNIKGQAAHAGTDHQKGINACSEAAFKASRIHNLTDYSKNLTVNVGVMSGGSKPNVVCEASQIRLDIRYKEAADLEDMLREIQVINDTAYVHSAESGEATSSQVEEVVQMPSFPPASSEKIIEKAAESALEHQHDFQHRHVGYGSDGNHLSQLPIQILVGVGPYGGGMHTQEEFMNINSYNDRLNSNRDLVLKLLEEGNE